jgi:hypothetical protein
MLIAALFLSTSASAQMSGEAVKATFLYRFASFVTWPPAAFADPSAPISICVIGSEPFAHALERAVAGQRVEGRAFAVRRLTSASASCHVVYVVGERVQDTLRAMRGRPVLTVTDGAVGPGGARGMIHFVVVDDRIRFHIDEARAAESGLFMSSRLLTLAVSVRRRRA